MSSLVLTMAYVQEHTHIQADIMGCRARIGCLTSTHATSEDSEVQLFTGVKIDVLK